MQKYFRTVCARGWCAFAILRWQLLLQQVGSPGAAERAQFFVSGVRFICSALFAGPE